MRHVVVGTAGHIDHGKTSLVKALTGTDTDRLPEEKARGITIDLGFAFLEEAGELVIEIVDVPGHERFVRNMLAGAGGIDLALLVVAADEGVMPQTREHLAICQILRIKSGLVVLSKADLAEPDWIELVRDDVRRAVADTFLAGASDRAGVGEDGRGAPRAAGRARRAGAGGAAQGSGSHRAAADRPGVHRQGIRHRGDRHPRGGPPRDRREGRGVPAGRAVEGPRPAGARPRGGAARPPGSAPR